MPYNTLWDDLIPDFENKKPYEVTTKGGQQLILMALKDIERRIRNIEYLVCDIKENKNEK